MPMWMVLVTSQGLDKDHLRRYSEGGHMPISACLNGEIPKAILARNFDRARSLAQEYIDIFGKDNFS